MNELVTWSNSCTLSHERTQSYVVRDAKCEEMKDALQNDEASSCSSKGFYLEVWWCKTENELKIKEEWKATMQCCPLDEDVVEGSKCFYSSEDADRMALFARSFRKFVCFFMKKN